MASVALPWVAPPEILSLKVVTFKGGRSLSGLERISAESAETLAQFQGERLFLEGLKDPSDRVLNAFRSSDASVVTPLGQLGEPRNAADSR